MNQFEILQARVTLGLSQRILAILLDTTVTTISRWENGKAIPNKIYITQIKKLLAKNANKAS